MKLNNRTDRKCFCPEYVNPILTKAETAVDIY
jgi:hypothetical protein